MDSHCEVNDGWLEPLLAEVVRNPRAVAIPLIDPTHFDTFAIGQAIAEIGVFSWALEFHWLSPPATKIDKERQLIEPYHCPIMCGGIFAMGREYFLQAGTYDEDMDTWGGENFEMSFRLWMCGGELVTVPCSRIAHVFRKRSPYKFKNRDPALTIAHNLNRVATVWMDSYRDVYQMVGRRFDKSPEFGDVSARLALRDRLKCKSFDWYMDTVGSIHSMFTPVAANYFDAGLLRNEHTQQCIYHEGNPVPGDRLLAVMRNCAGHFDAQNEGPEAMYWYHTRAPHPRELRHEAAYGARCLFVDKVEKDARVSLTRCYDHETDAKALQWDYNLTTKQFSLVNFPTGCLTASKDAPDQVIVSKCKGGPRQQWTFVPWDRAAATPLTLA
jgi:polypeptide N-acetylgalactosaminyltransferase